MNRHRLMAAAAAGALLTTLGMGTALAAPPTGGISGPGDGATIEDATIAGSFNHPGGFEGVSLTIKETAENDPIPSPKVNGCDNGVVACDGDTASFSWSPNLPYNGVYKVEARATGVGHLLNPSESVTSTRTFSLAAPPAAPRKVDATVDSETRVVTVTWRANNEPDLLGYILVRNDGGRAEVAKSDAATASFVDASTAERGGTYTYAVQAVRKGASGSSTVSSEPASSGPVAVSDPPPPPTTTTEGPAAGGGDGGATPTSAPGATPTTGAAAPRPTATPLVRGGTADLGSFTALRARNTSPPPTAPPEIDTGYQETLPYGATPSTLAAGDDPVIPGEAPQVALPVSRSSGDGSDDRRALLIPIAAGLILFVGALQMRWVAGHAVEPLEAL